MKPLSKTETWGVLLGAAFVVYGIIEIANPQTGNMPQTTDAYRSVPSQQWSENVTETKARVYGVLAILMGVGIITASFYGRKQ